MENLEKQLHDVKDELKEFCEINFMRLHDRFDELESQFDLAIKKKLTKSEVAIFDNQDLMEITQLSYRRLQEYRTLKLLHPFKRKGKNFYTQDEINRFIREVLNANIDR